MRRRRRRTAAWTVGAVLAVAVLAVAVVAVVVVTRPATTPVPTASSSAPVPEQERLRLGCRKVTTVNALRHDATVPVSTGGPVVGVLGDSYAMGTMLADPKEQACPAPLGRALGATTWVDAVEASGYVNPGYCGNQSSATRVPGVLSHHPSTVIVEGGFNDLSARPPVLSAAVGDVLRRLQGVPRVVVVGRTAPLSVPLSRIEAVDQTLQQASARAGRQYVSTVGWRLPYSSDGVHPTPEGQLAYAQLLFGALTRSPA